MYAASYITGGSLLKPNRVLKWGSGSATAIGPRTLLSCTHLGQGSGTALATPSAGPFGGRTSVVLKTVDNHPTRDLCILTIADAEADLPDYYTLPTAVPVSGDSFRFYGTGRSATGSPLAYDATRDWHMGTNTASSISYYSYSAFQFNLGLGGTEMYCCNGDSGGAVCNAAETIVYALMAGGDGGTGPVDGNYSSAINLYPHLAWIGHGATSGAAIIAAVMTTVGSPKTFKLTFDETATFSGAAGDIALNYGGVIYRNTGAPVSGNGTAIVVFNLEVATPNSPPGSPAMVGTFSVKSGVLTGGTTGFTNSAVTESPFTETDIMATPVLLTAALTVTDATTFSVVLTFAAAVKTNTASTGLEADITDNTNAMSLTFSVLGSTPIGALSVSGTGTTVLTLTGNASLAALTTFAAANGASGLYFDPGATYTKSIVDNGDGTTVWAPGTALVPFTSITVTAGTNNPGTTTAAAISAASSPGAFAWKWRSIVAPITGTMVVMKNSAVTTTSLAVANSSGLALVTGTTGPSISAPVTSGQTYYVGARSDTGSVSLSLYGLVVAGSSGGGGRLPRGR
jgi:hypothetical protein